jgi:hypothetical protein
MFLITLTPHSIVSRDGTVVAVNAATTFILRLDTHSCDDNMD